MDPSAGGHYGVDLTWLGTMLIGIGSVTSAIVGWWAGRRSHRTQELAEAKAQTTEADLRTAQSRQDNAAEIEATTSRFQTLIDGYERRIADLTHEVDQLRAEVIRLRDIIDMYLRPPAAPVGK